MSKLVIDIGNTLSKVAIFQGEDLVRLWVDEQVNPKALEDLVRDYHIKRGIVSTVRQSDSTVGLLKSMGLDALLASPRLKHPLRMGYRSPESLGTDRLAAAVAVHHLFPKKNVLVVNVGSCLTTDLVNDAGEYLGGTIAPGLRMRFKALHESTGKLPLVDIAGSSDPDSLQETIDKGNRAGKYSPEPEIKKPPEPARKPEMKKPPGHAIEPMTPRLPGQTTRESIQAGVVCGMLAEIDGLIEQYNNELRLFKVILSGGDIKVFDKKLKNRIFAVANIVLHGLNQMLEYNA